MKNFKTVSAMLAALAMATVLGCAPTATHEGTGEYFDDTMITTKVKSAILQEPTLKSAEINVETFKGIVQLSGFVGDANNSGTATRVAQSVQGVKSVKNDIRVK